MIQDEHGSSCEPERNPQKHSKSGSRQDRFWKNSFTD